MHGVGSWNPFSYAFSLLISATFFPWALWKMMGCTIEIRYSCSITSSAEKLLSWELSCCVVNNSRILKGAITSTLQITIVFNQRILNGASCHWGIIPVKRSYLKQSDLDYTHTLIFFCMGQRFDSYIILGKRNSISKGKREWFYIYYRRRKIHNLN